MPNWNVCCRRAPTPFFPLFFSSALWLLVEYYSWLRRTGKCKDKAAAYQATQHEKNLQIRPSGYKFTLLAHNLKECTPDKPAPKTKGQLKIKPMFLFPKSVLLIIMKRIEIFKSMKYYSGNVTFKVLFSHEYVYNFKQSYLKHFNCNE